MQFTLSEAQEYSRQGRIEQWVHAYLDGPGRNPAFTEGLKRAPRWWIGPVEVELTRLRPALGTAPEFEYVVEPEPHERYVSAMVESLHKGWQPAPLIVEYRGADQLSVRDGNHRCEALCRCGRRRFWTIIYLNSSQDFDVFVQWLREGSDSGV